MTKCQGCGIPLQTTNPNIPGYTDNITNKICKRCFRLSHYGEYQKVGLTNKDYQKIINQIPQDNLIIYTCDILSLNLTNLPKHKNILLTITKKDILPKSIKDSKIINYIKKNINVLDIIIISSQKNYNIDNLYNLIKKYYHQKDVYLVGSTNSGKSTLINKLQKNYTNNEDYPQVTTSMYPSTTLDQVKIPLNDITIIDTPGLIEENNIINYLSSKDLKKIIPKLEIKPKTCQIHGQGSIIIDKYVRIDYDSKIPSSLVIYASTNLNIRFNSLNKDNLKNLNCTTFNLQPSKDIVIPGLGFIKFTKEIKVKIYTLNEIIPYQRENLI